MRNKLPEPPKILPNRIAWVVDDDGIVIEKGMNKEEICKNFPPYRSSDDLPFNRKQLLRSLIYEEYRLVGKNRAPGNVRRFWYTNLIYTFQTILGDHKIHCISSDFSKALTSMVEVEKLFRYSDLNITSDKDNYRSTFVQDSPYPNLIFAIEKKSYYDELKHLSEIYGATFISTGGQPSLGVAEHLIDDLIEHGVDINKTFHIIFVSDFDPAGYFMQDRFAEQLQNLGIKECIIHRAAITPDQLTPQKIEHCKIPCKDVNAETEKAKKGSATKYKKFAERTGGLIIDGVSYKIELEALSVQRIRELFVEYVEKVIDGRKYCEPIAEEAIASEERSVADTLSEEHTSEIDGRIEWLDQIARTRTSDIDARISELYDEIRELKEEKDERTQNLDEKKDELEELKSQIESEIYDGVTELDIQYQDIKSVSKLPSHEIHEQAKKGYNNFRWFVRSNDRECINSYVTSVAREKIENGEIAVSEIPEE